MQNKAAIIVLAIALGLVSIYQLSFTGATYKVKKEARLYSKGDLEKETKYLDSISALPKEKWSFLGNTFKDCQKKELNLGLDLKGGMNVILEVSVEDILKALSNYNPDKTFNLALARAKEMQKNSQSDYLTLFGKAFQEVDPNAKLASVFGTVELKEKINFNSTNEQVLKVLDTEVTGAISNAFNILRTRIDRFGVVQPNITNLATKGQILIELPGQNNPKRVRELLQGTANLEFWETYENSEIVGYLSKANNILKEMQVNTAKTNSITSQTASSTTSSDTTKKDQSLLDLINKDTTKAVTASTREGFTLQNPLFGILIPRVTAEGQPLPSCMIGLANAKDTAMINTYLKMNQIKALFPRDLKLMWSQNPYKQDPTKTMYELHAIKITTRDGRPPLGGDAITAARTSTGVSGDVKVDMSMNGEGSKTWARMTRENIGRCLVVVLDGYVRSYPRVQNEITGGSTEITGDFTIEEADDLANILKSGKLPAPSHIISDTIVGPTLGKEAINSGFISFFVAFALVLGFMVFYYSKSAGTIADIALFANLFLLFGVLASMNAVLSLPGIAGIVLTMGMDVDANILIFERIREELRGGKGIKLAIADGYKRAYPAIIDSKVTTMLTGIVLYVFGSGPIKGFATTLIIGILTSIFASIFLTRLMYEALLKRNVNLHFSIKLTENVFKHTKIDFIGMRKYFYIISGVIITSGIISLFVRGLNPGIDFAGGRSYVIRFEKPVVTEEIASKLEVAFGNLPQVVTYGKQTQVKITTNYKINESGAEDEVDTKLYEGLKSFLPADVTKEVFLSDKYRVSSETVGAVVAADIKINAFYSVGIALILIFLYIFMRYKYWQYGFGAVASLAHDVLLVLGVYSLLWGHMPFSMEIDQSFIAAILTVIGFSVSDTVIVFDRTREFLPLYRKRPFKEVLNMALNSTLSRTINTTFAVILTILAMFIFGGAVIRGFMFALLVGIGTGVYSSVFVATALMYDTTPKSKDMIEETKVKVKASI